MAGNKATGAPAEEALPPGARIGKVRWTICAMLFAATTINYMDRTVLGLLKPTIQHAIGMTEVNYGLIVGGFTIAYALGGFFAGRFVDKVGTRIGYMVVMALWSLSAMAHALANSVVQFAVARFCLGIGESGNFPAALKTVAEWFPQKERSLATGIFNSGANIGVIMASLLVPIVTLHFGWHASFLITGVFSAFWILWWFFHYSSPSDHPDLAAAELAHIRQEPPQKSGPSTPWIKLFAYPQTWAFAMGKFLTDPIWWFYLYWLPSFFSVRFHLNLSHLGLPLFIVYTASMVGSVLGGWLPAPFRRLGLPTSNARLAAMLFCACLVVPVFLINFLQSEWAAIALLSLATAAHQGFSANLLTTPSDMFPPTAVGSVVGIGGMFGSTGGFLLATFAGYILQLTHSYASLFAIAASAYLVSMVLTFLLAPGLKKVELFA